MLVTSGAGKTENAMSPPGLTEASVLSKSKNMQVRSWLYIRCCGIKD